MLRQFAALGLALKGIVSPRLTETNNGTRFLTPEELGIEEFFPAPTEPLEDGGTEFNGSGEASTGSMCMGSDVSFFSGCLGVSGGFANDAQLGRTAAGISSPTFTEAKSGRRFFSFGAGCDNFDETGLEAVAVEEPGFGEVRKLLIDGDFEILS